MAGLARYFLDEYAPGYLKPGTAAFYYKIIDKRILPPDRNQIRVVGRNRIGSIH